MYETRAGPKERVGLSEQPSTGISIVWPMYTAKPMATGARAALALFFLFTAVSRTTYMRMKTMMASPRKAWRGEKPGPTRLDPKPFVRSEDLR